MLAEQMGKFNLKFPIISSTGTLTVKPLISNWTRPKILLSYTPICLIYSVHVPLFQTLSVLTKIVEFLES